MKKVFAILSVLSILMTSAVFAHESRVIGAEGEQQYKLIVGLLNEPIYHNLRTGLDMYVRNAEDDSPINGLESSLQVTITAPTGEVRELNIHAQHGKEGAYTDALFLTQPGAYQVHVTGFIGALEVDEVFERVVGDINDITFP